MTTTAKIHQPYELVGRRIGHVTVLQCLGTYNKMKKYLVRCECGNLHTTYGKTLISLGKNNTDYTCDLCRKDKQRLTKMRFLKMIDSKALSAWNYMIKVCYQKDGNINRTISTGQFVKSGWTFSSFSKIWVSQMKMNVCFIFVNLVNTTKKCVVGRIRKNSLRM